MAEYVNPLRSIRNLKMGRTDQGVDVTGTGPVLAMGSGRVLSTTNSGWPGGGFIVIALDNPISGHGAYYTAEDINPSVSVGQRVRAGQQIGTAYAGSSGLELGWAATGGQLGESAYRAQAGGAAYSEGTQTAQGKSFAAMLQGLMGGQQPASSTGSASSTGGASSTGLTDVTQQGAGNGTSAAAGGCLIAMVAWPVLIPLALVRQGRRDHSHERRKVFRSASHRYQQSSSSSDVSRPGSVPGSNPVGR